MTNEPTGALLPVEQVDREAAADLGDVLGWSALTIQRVRKGGFDHWRTVQAFAAYRLAHTQTPAPEVEAMVERLEADHSNLR